MKPKLTTEIDLRFSAPVSPWWLLLLIPLVLAVAWHLYRSQLRSVDRASRAVLMALRLALLGLIVLVAFRPSLIYRKILTYSGRILFVVDDSESMTAKDSGLSDEEAVHLARRLEARSERPEQGEACYALAETLAELESLVRRFEIFARSADRDDSFWDRAGATHGSATDVLDEFDRLAGGVAQLDEPTKARFDETLSQAKRLRADLTPFFTGERNPGRKVYDSYYATVAALVGKLLEIQATIDRKALAEGNERLRTVADAIKGQSRLELMTRKLVTTRDSFASLAPGQNLFIVRLMEGAQAEIATIGAIQLTSVRGATDIVGRLERLVKAESDFPLSAIILLSDGQDLTGKPARILAQEFARKQVPVYAAGVGALTEPLDLAVLKIVAPPFTARGMPVKARVRVKTRLEAPVPVRFSILDGDEQVASAKVTVGAKEQEHVTVPFTSPDAGIYRYTLNIESAPGEAFPVQNNSADFAINVRENKVKVLFLDGKPRWETRFALNILRRMDYIDLNSVIALVQEESRVKRGVRKGTWPEDMAALEMYDLVVLGDLPEELLTPSEWADLQAYVEEKGKTVCFIGSGLRDPVPTKSELSAHLLPLKPRAPGENAASALEDLSDLQLAEAGRFHPVTRLLTDALGTQTTERSPRLLADTQVLLVAKETDQPLVSGRFVGKGKVLYLDTDRLWKLLNPTHLPAHAGMYIGMVSWAIEGGYATPAAAEQKPSLALDQRTLQANDPLQVWVTPVAENVTVQAKVEGEVVAEVKPTATRAGASMARAAFTRLPSEKISVCIKEHEAETAQDVVVIEDYAELKYLARNEAFLKELAKSTGGEYREFTDLEKFFLGMKFKERVEKLETVWRIWNTWTLLTILVVLLTIEWVWRKFVGLV